MKNPQIIYRQVNIYIYVCMCVCVCVWNNVIYPFYRYGNYNK